MKKYILFLFVLLTFTAVQCKKDNPQDQLPPITTTGANTFGCLVNGNAFLPYSFVHNPAALWVSGPDFGGFGKSPSVSILANDTKLSQKPEIEISLRNLKGIGTYKIYNYLNDGLVYSDEYQEYEPFDTFGTVKIIYLDTSRQIVSGTFSFTGYTDTTRSKSISITNGRFDVHWPYKN